MIEKPVSVAERAIALLTLLTVTLAAATGSDKRPIWAISAIWFTRTVRMSNGRIMGWDCCAPFCIRTASKPIWPLRVR